MDMTRRGMWKDTSRRLVNTGELFSQRLAPKCVREVNRHRDEDDVQYARKAMQITGMGRNLNVMWEVGQLTPALQSIVKKHQAIFDASRTATINAS